MLYNKKDFDKSSPIVDSTFSGVGGSSRSNSSSKKPMVIYLDENGNECSQQRVRKVVKAQARQVTVVSYSRRHRESHSHTSHYVTTVRYTQTSFLATCQNLGTIQLMIMNAKCKLAKRETCTMIYVANKQFSMSF